MVKKRLNFKHPFNDYPFEAMCCGSWQAVEKIRIRNGTTTLHLVNDQFMVLEKGPYYADFRLRSRQATASDCTCFLRPGVDICVISPSHSEENTDVQGSEPVWIDAKISSIERRPHETGCSCQFYVQLYANKKPLGSEKPSICKEIVEMGIDQIFVLQKLQKNFCSDSHYRWDLSEDCSLLQKTKVLLGKFVSDLSWLVVTSALKHITFDIRSLDNKILYQVLEGNQKSTSGASDNILYVINFKGDDGVFIPIIHQLNSSDKIEMPPEEDVFDNQLNSLADPMDLRRSKRRNVQPDRFLGCDSIDESEIDYSGTRIYKTEQLIEHDDEMTLPLACLFGPNASSSKVNMDNESNNNFNKLSLRDDDLSDFKSRVSSLGMRSGTKSATSHEVEEKNQLAIVPVIDEPPITYDPYTFVSNGCGNSTTNGCDNFRTNGCGNFTKQITEMSSRYYYINNKSNTKKRKFSEVEDTNLENSSRWGKASSSKGRRRYGSIRYKEDGSPEEKPWHKRSLGAGAYKDLINSFLKNIDSTIKIEEPQIIDQWKEFKNTTSLEKRIEKEPPSNEKEEEECSEIDMLWREMEISLASSYLMDSNEDFSNGTSFVPEHEENKWCHHEFKLNEEIGMVCHICGFVSTEIKDVSAPFMQHTSWISEGRQIDEKDEHNTDDDDEMNIFCGRPSNETLSEENDNVWALIPEFRRKLHLHQKKAFEFLWKNVAGSMVPALMEQSSRKIGGCVISHTPGAGKTFLIISFLASYLKLFPGKRPLVLAPKTTLYTWYKEFIKWEVPVPIHLIHGRRTYRVFRSNSKPVAFSGPKPTDDVMHILDCLEKIKKWHAHPSVLVMGYTSFLTLMREDAKFAHRKYMAKVLRQSPGILILDEGHNPRSTKSRLRKVLMKVETDLRILLSGTLFQNNFCEYFNTLCLARPKFVNEVLKKLDPKFKRKKKKKAPHLLEARARKLFLDKIARKIDAGDGEDQRREGLKMLRSLTSRFIDVYEGGSKDGLPGLQIYTLLMNTTDIQQHILNKLHEIMAKFPGYPLELELLITLGSIHPWLVKAAVCASKFFSERELTELDRYKFDLRKGSKVMFVLNLVYRVVKKEKVLIFCHNIAPIKLFIELFENVFRWKKGREILALTGDLELFERGKVMDRFEDPTGPSKVLLASITACAEGISLTAASRVILLDSEWNPSKTKQAIARAFRPGQLKVVYVYQLLVTGTLEEDKHKRTTWKEWVSSMIFSEAFVEDPSKWQAEKIEDDVLREMVEEDRVKTFHMIMKNEKASTVIREKD